MNPVDTQKRCEQVQEAMQSLSTSILRPMNASGGRGHSGDLGYFHGHRWHSRPIFRHTTYAPIKDLEVYINNHALNTYAHRG